MSDFILFGLGFIAGFFICSQVFRYIVDIDWDKGYTAGYEQARKGYQLEITNLKQQLIREWLK